MKEIILEDLKRLFIYNEIRSSQMFHIPKRKTSRFGLNTLISYDDAKLCNKYLHALLHKEIESSEMFLYDHASYNLTISRLILMFVLISLFSSDDLQMILRKSDNSHFISTQECFSYTK